MRHAMRTAGTSLISTLRPNVAAYENLVFTFVALHEKSGAPDTLLATGNVLTAATPRELCTVP